MPVDLLAEGQSPSAYEIFSGGHTYLHPPAAADEAVNGQAVPALETGPFGPLGGWPKRVTDLGVALTALVLAAPIMLAVAGMIRITTRGPALFAHSRVGFRGKPFACYKFRTMVANADEALADYLARDPQAAQEWAETRKLRHDPRITRLGHVLRKSSLDELPQLFNVLRGEMSCVGPRPVVTEELGLYGASVREYLSTRPGLTGLWQVTGRSSTDFARRVSLDSHYVRNWSLLADLTILFRTTFAVLRLNEAC
jgi:exopolysaccharide production protein ExoY